MLEDLPTSSPASRTALPRRFRIR